MTEMALRKIESFGWLQTDSSTWLPKRWSSVNGGNLGSPGRRASSNYFACNNWTPDALRQNFDNQTTWSVHCAIKFVQDARALYFGDSGNAQIWLKYSTAMQTLQIWRGDLSTLLAESAADAALQNIWHHLACKVVIDNVAGSYEVRLNGTVILSATGVDTQQTANAYANQVAFNAQHVHDIVICDGTGSAPYNGILGDCAVYCLLPNGAGAVTGWTPAAGSNYQNVDDSTPDTDSTYNSTAAAGATDRYAIASPTLTGSCRGVCVAAMVRKDDAAARTARVKLYDGTTLQSGSTVALPDSYQMIESVWQVNPTSGTHWTAAELAAAEPGIELVS